jgi:hypothetical protein
MDAHATGASSSAPDLKHIVLAAKARMKHEKSLAWVLSTQARLFNFDADV